MLRFYSLFNIKYHITAPYHLQSNGKVEQIIQTLKQGVKKLLNKDFKEYLRALQVATAAYNMVLHEATGFSPFQLLYGRDALMPDKLPFTEYKSNEDYKQALSSHIETMI